jgi:hypothetical protein
MAYRPDSTNPATADDVVLERPLTPEEEAVLPAWLDAAWRALKREVKGIPARLTLDASSSAALTRDDVGQVIGAMVERKLRNPDGLRSWTTEDVQQTIDAALSTGQLYVTDAEKASLAVPVPGGGMFSIPVSR